MDSIPAKQLEQFVAAAHWVAEYGLVVCASGNLSWRVGDDHMLITETNSWLKDLSADQVALCRISDMKCLNDKRPSKEVGFHASILNKRPEVNLVLHYNSPFATAVACGETPIDNFFVIPEVPHYIGQIAVVPFIQPGSRELAEAVTSAMTDHSLVILRNHGLVTIGKTVNDVIEKASYFELACRIILTGGESVQSIPQEFIPALGRSPKP
jgi:ribulose-5-phosphate 4-epimerase/fuculose-1-phosphate aldolase